MQFLAVGDSRPGLSQTVSATLQMRVDGQPKSPGGRAREGGEEGGRRPNGSWSLEWQRRRTSWACIHNLMDGERKEGGGAAEQWQEQGIEREILRGHRC